MSHPPAGFRYLQYAAFVAFTAISSAIAVEVARGAQTFGLWWMLPLLALIAYAVADLASGFVHFLADNFGSPDTPFVGPAFVLPFREHHRDPTGILRHPFFVTNGNNCLVSLPPLLLVWWLVPLSATRVGYLFGFAYLAFSLSILLTNQFHKWAHTESPPRWVQALMRRGVILSTDHHNVHHAAPFDTHYCITVGWWNPLLQRIHFFEHAERMIRRWIPGVDREKPVMSAARAQTH